MTAYDKGDNCVDCVLDKGKCATCVCPDITGFFEKIIELKQRVEKLEEHKKTVRIGFDCALEEIKALILEKRRKR